ncbi:hypothetical protein ACP8HZ_07910 [Francisella noatunensis]
MHESPHTAAATSIGANTCTFKLVAAPVSPSAKSKESPGKRVLPQAQFHKKSLKKVINKSNYQVY